MFGNLWITLPVQCLTGNHVLAANFLVFMSFILCAYTTFLLVRSLTGSAIGSVVAGVVFSFNPYRWAEAHHLQLLPMYWSPLALWCLHEFLGRRRTPALVGAAVFLVLQVYASIYLGVMLFVMALAFGLIYSAITRTGVWSLVRDQRVYMVAVAAMFAIAPLAIPYGQANNDWDFSRSESENSSFSAEPLSFLVPTESFRNYPGLETGCAGHIRGAYGLGMTPWLLGGVALFLGWRFGANPARTSFAWTAVLMGVLMLGPYLVWFNQKTSVPLPYLLVYHLLPGAQALRVPARFVFPLLMCLAVLSGFAVVYLQAIWRRWRPALRIAVCAAGALFFAFDYAVARSPGVRLESRDEFPPVYDYLAACRPGEPVLELPADIRKQFRYLHYQTAHWRPLVGGETGCYTPAVLELARRTQGPPTEDTLRFIELTTAETVVIHLDQYDQHTAAGWYAADVSRFGFERMGRIGNAFVWERRRRIAEPSDQLRVVEAKARRVDGRWRDGWRIDAVVAAAIKGKPWRYLERGLDEVDVTLVGTDGAEHSYRATIAPPTYLLAGESATVSIGKLNGGPAEVRAVHVRGKVIVKEDS
jgi:hypothetical protein